MFQPKKVVPKKGDATRGIPLQPGADPYLVMGVQLYTQIFWLDIFIYGVYFNTFSAQMTFLANAMFGSKKWHSKHDLNIIQHLRISSAPDN